MTNYKPCIIIPNYNHSQYIAKVIEHLLAFKTKIFIINDGSNDETKKRLIQLSEKYPELSLIHLKQNQGKGGAVIHGFKEAAKLGYSHALQIDADGQHALDDVPAFLEQSRANPDAVIYGIPIYDKSVPLGRLIPRYITHFWVWIETLSFKIKDSMCGYRMYPLEPTLCLIESETIGRRMDFDTEILVRLNWRDIPQIPLSTKVIYPLDGSSQFNLFKDNWLITKMHTRLFFGMLKRFPRIIAQKIKVKKNKHWSKTEERGSSFGISVLVFFSKIFGFWLFKLFLYPISFYFLLTGKQARSASRKFLSQVNTYQGRKEKVRWSNIFSHFYQFGLSSIEKIQGWLGKMEFSELPIHGQQHFDKLQEDKQGAIFLGSHLGNIELCRALGQRHTDTKLNTFIFSQHAQKFQKAIKDTNNKASLNLIPVETIGPDTAILLKEKIDQGEIVIIVGDRTSATNHERVHLAPFLGKPAPFAEGPFILASLLDCPVYLLFCIKQSKQYNVYLEPFSDSLKCSRKERQAQLQHTIQRYASRLEHYCLKAPYQWFNFFDFWKKHSSPLSSTKLDSSHSTSNENANHKS